MVDNYGESYLEPRTSHASDVSMQARRVNLFRDFHDEDEHINVFLRVKPRSRSEKEPSNLVVVNDHILKVDGVNRDTGKSHQFRFSRIFPPSTSQQDLFNGFVVDIVRDFVNGQNRLLFAYGTTNAGKTYTMQGTSTQPGIVPRCLDVLFNSIRDLHKSDMKVKPANFADVVLLNGDSWRCEEEAKSRILRSSHDKLLANKHHGASSKLATSAASSSSEESLNSVYSDDIGSCQEFLMRSLNDFQDRVRDDTRVSVCLQSNMNCSVWISCAEIYNETVYDLLDRTLLHRGKPKPLKFVEDRNGNAYIKDLRQICVNSSSEAYMLLVLAMYNLHFASTKLNHNSSRSHCIFTIKLLKVANPDDPVYAHSSILTFCDLAGAERADKTGNIGGRLKEAANINTSLLVLGRCISALRERQRQKEKPMVPYRESRLTKMLWPFLSGKGKTSIIVNVCQSPNLHDETIGVLKFAAIAKEILLETKRESAPRCSRFSTFVTAQAQKGSAIWESTHVQASTFSAEALPEVREEVIQEEETEADSVYESLMEKIEKIQAELKREKKEKSEIEKNIREELYTEFNKMLAEVETACDERVKEVELRAESNTEWKIKKLEEYYEQQRKRKRYHNTSADSDDDSEDEYEKIASLQDEVKYLKEKNETLEQTLKKMNSEKKSQTLKATELQMELGLCKTNMESMRKLQVVDFNLDENDLPMDDIHKQLRACEANIRAKDETIKNLESLLAEGGKDFIANQQEIEKLMKELDEKDHIIVQLEEQIGDDKEQINGFQSCLTQKNSSEENKDKEIERLNATVEQLQKALRFKDKNSEVVEHSLQETLKNKNKHIEDYIRERSDLLLEIGELREKVNKMTLETLKQGNAFPETKDAELNVNLPNEAYEKLMKEKSDLQNCLDKKEGELLNLKVQLQENKLSSERGVSEMFCSFITDESELKFRSEERKQLKELQAAVKEYEVVCQDMERAITELKSKEEILLQENENKDAKIAEKNEVIERLEEINQKCTCSMLSSQLKELQLLLNEEKSNNEELTQKLKASESVVSVKDELVEQISQLEDNVSSQKKTIDEKQGELHRVSEELCECRKVIALLEEQKACIQKEADESASIVSDQLQSLCALKDQNNELMEKASSLEHKLEEMQKVHAEELSSKTAEKEKLMERVSQLEQELLNVSDKLKSENDKSLSLETTRNQVQLELDEKEKELSELRNEKEALEVKYRENSKLQEELLALRYDLESKSKEINKLRRMLEEKESIIKDNISSKEREISILQKDLKSVIATANKMQEGKQEEIRKLQDSLKNAEHHCLQRSQMAREKETEVEKLQIQLQGYIKNEGFFKTLAQETEYAKARNSDLEIEIRQLRDALEMKDREMQSFTDNRNQMISQYEASLRKKQEEAEREKHEVKRLREVLSKSTPTKITEDLESKVSRLEEKLKQANEDIKDKDQRIHSLQHKLRNIKPDNSDYLADSEQEPEENAKSQSRCRTRIPQKENLPPPNTRDRTRRGRPGRDVIPPSDDENFEPTTRGRKPRRCLLSSSAQEFSYPEVSSPKVRNEDPAKIVNRQLRKRI